MWVVSHFGSWESSPMVTWWPLRVTASTGSVLIGTLGAPLCWLLTGWDAPCRAEVGSQGWLAWCTGFRIQPRNDMLTIFDVLIVLLLISRSPTEVMRWWGSSDRLLWQSFQRTLERYCRGAGWYTSWWLFQAGIVQIMADLSRVVLFAPGLLNFSLWYSPLELSEEPARVTWDT